MTALDIAAIRRASGLTQSQLAHRMRVSVRAVQMWEQGLRKPGGPAVLMLEVIARESQRIRELPARPKRDTLGKNRRKK
jgi:putative transcriptional regulator